MKPTNNIQKADGAVFMYKPVLWSCFWGIAATGLLLSLFALAYSLYDLPLELMGFGATISLAIGCFTAGFVCAHMSHQKGMMWGGICGCTLFILLLIICGLLPQAFVGIAAFFRLFLMAISGMIGGIVGVNFLSR